MTLNYREDMLALVRCVAVLHLARLGSSFSINSAQPDRQGRTPIVRRGSHRNLKTALSFLPQFDTDEGCTQLLGKAFIPIANAPIAQFITSQQDNNSKNMAEAEVLNDISHIGLDLPLAEFFKRRSWILPLVTVAGRLCAVGSEYISGQPILPEEMIYQAIMLGLAVASLVRAASIPYAAASAAQPTLRDGKTFRALFAPAGVSWNQYKALSAFAFEWVTVSEGDEVVVSHDDDDDDASMYWLYSGRVQVETPGKPTYVASRDKKNRLGGGATLIGERQLLYHVFQARNAPPPAKESMSARVVSSEAVVLRINIPNLKVLIGNDPDLEMSMRNLFVQAMEAKMSTLWKQGDGVMGSTAVLQT